MFISFHCAATASTSKSYIVGSWRLDSRPALAHGKYDHVDWYVCCRLHFTCVTSTPLFRRSVGCRTPACRAKADANSIHAYQTPIPRTPPVDPMDQNRRSCTVPVRPLSDLVFPSFLLFNFLTFHFSISQQRHVSMASLAILSAAENSLGNMGSEQEYTTVYRAFSVSFFLLSLFVTPQKLDPL